MANHSWAMAQKTLLCAVVCIGAFSSLLAQVRVGEMAPEIELPNTNSELVRLSSLKGKVVLIDFWASWCRPCREANPGVIRLYKKYRSQGFEVFGVSIDAKKDSWLRAIKQDGIPYAQVNDPAGWKSIVAQRWGVEAIPTTFLLDRTGKIRAIDAEGAALDRMVRLLLKP